MWNFLKKKNNEIKDLTDLNEELENYFRNTIIPQLFVDADLILRKFTPPAMKQFKFTPEHIGKHMGELVDNIRYSTIMENIQEVIYSGQILEKSIQTTDMRWFQMNIIPYIVRKTNKPNGVIITFIDITNRIRDIRLLEKLIASHETFIYSVSHDLKAPLANIDGLIQHLTEHCKDDGNGQRTLVQMLDTAVQRMRNIITDLSEVTKVEGKFEEKVERVNFDEILEEVELTIKDKIDESKAIIHADIKEAEFIFSRKNLRSIVYNLLSNAIKYRSPARNPEIAVKTEKENGFVKISVKDNGLGIQEEKKDLIFEQFSRVEKNVEGSGIGLYLIKKIIENEGGKIMVDSKIGEGSEFKVYLKSKN